MSAADNTYPGDVPAEVFAKMLSFINDPRDFQNLQLVSREVRKAANEFVWKNLNHLKLAITYQPKRRGVSGVWRVRMVLNDRLVLHASNMALLARLSSVRVLSFSFQNGWFVDDTNEVEQFLEAFIDTGKERGWKIQRLLHNIEVILPPAVLPPGCSSYYELVVFRNAHYSCRRKITGQKLFGWHMEGMLPCARFECSFAPSASCKNEFVSLMVCARRSGSAVSGS